MDVLKEYFVIPGKRNYVTETFKIKINSTKE